MVRRKKSTAYAMLKRLKENGFTLNEAKCEFCKTELDFSRQHFSKNGISLSDMKVNAFLNASRPETPAAPHSFLGLSSNCSRFIRNYSTSAEPLWRLIRKNEKWNWTDIQENAFIKLKKTLSTKAMSYFNKDWITELTVGAGPIWLGAILTQINPKDPMISVKLGICKPSFDRVQDKSSQERVDKIYHVFLTIVFKIVYIFLAINLV